MQETRTRKFSVGFKPKSLAIVVEIPDGLIRVFKRVSLALLSVVILYSVICYVRGWNRHRDLLRYARAVGVEVISVNQSGWKFAKSVAAADFYRIAGDSEGARKASEIQVNVHDVGKYDNIVFIFQYNACKAQWTHTKVFFAK